MVAVNEVLKVVIDSYNNPKELLAGSYKEHL